MNKEEIEPMGTLGVGIIGLHHLHPVDYLPHFEALAETKVLAIAEADAAYLSRVCEGAGIHGDEDYGKLLARSDIGLVALFLPHVDCPEAVERAAEAGKHVIVEKPMADTSDGIRRMIAATRKAGVMLSSAYCWRYHPASRQIKRLVDEGLLGDVVALEGRCAAGSPLRYFNESISPWLVEKASAGGGPMHNLGVHWIDLFRWLLEDEVDSATGMVSHAQHKLEVEDNSFGTIRFRGGATATLDISYSVPGSYPAGRDLFIAIRGTKGALSWSPAWGGTADEVFVVSDDSAWIDGPVRTLQIGSRDVQGYGGVSGLAYLRDVVAAIADGREPEVTGIDGLRAMEVVEAIYQSAETGKTVQVQQVD